ncbi:TetR/AcrR family transcriptional regulator [Bradyrhizobium sp. 164]|uniref:TetR/AcrR family transcriptional regulator n=1 Tax=Bradyrhizobium sp. 164 TaxID=2782637 RepID=UPI001FF90E40|nr:TetR/AcrR family transcriptional regulator [Bradyrhizobium sp. 164]MCK1597047.1 TetR/AcrR family transcriptional regulator [Bradyrhizobium sp. 164]
MLTFWAPMPVGFDSVGHIIDIRRMKNMTAKSELTRAQIIQGALQALEKTGVLATTTRKIAAEANVKLATLHYHFESKSALLVAVLEVLIEEIAERLREDRAGTDPSLDERIEILIRGTWRSITQSRARQIVQYELTLYALREGAQWLADQQYEAYLRLYRDQLASKSGKPQLSPRGYTTLARFILAGIDGLILQELVKPSRTRSNMAIEALIFGTKQLSRELLSPGGTRATLLR